MTLDQIAKLVIGTFDGVGVYARANKLDAITLAADLQKKGIYPCQCGRYRKADKCVCEEVEG